MNLFDVGYIVLSMGLATPLSALYLPLLIREIYHKNLPAQQVDQNKSSATGINKHTKIWPQLDQHKSNFVISEHHRLDIQFFVSRGNSQGAPHPF